MPATTLPEGIRKAAVLVASLDATTAEMLLARMGPQQARRVRQAASQMVSVDPQEQEEVLREFRGLGPSAPPTHPSGVELDGDLARRLAAAAAEPGPTRGTAGSWHERRDTAAPDGAGSLPQPRAAAPQRDPSEPPFCFLRETEMDKLVKILAAERPQVIALVLSHLPPPSAGHILSLLTPPVQVDVIRRLVDLEETDPETLRDVEQGLQRRLLEQVPMQRRRVAGLSAVTAILQTAEPRVGMAILDNLGRHDPGLMERIAPGQIDFADLMELDDHALATTIAAADAEIVLLAVVGASPEWLDRLLAHVPQQEAKRVRCRLDHFGPVRLSDVDEARRRLAELANRLVLEGRIQLPRPARQAVAA
jgi:flagellar motor switch protein FliG